MIHVNIKQGTVEWRLLRIGKVTGSAIKRILPGKNGYGKDRENYMSELADEYYSGRPTEYVETLDMKRGKELEPAARAEFELETGVTIYEVGFVTHDTIAGFGISPDGLSSLENPKRGFEIKCRKSSNHKAEIEKIINTGKIDSDANLQIHACMLCTGVQEWDYILYNPDVPDYMRIFYVTVKYDEHLGNMILSEVIKFRAELEGYINGMEKIKPGIKNTLAAYLAPGK